jgi:hypothetical protein
MSKTFAVLHTRKNENHISCSFVSASDSSEAEDLFVAHEGEANVDVTWIVETGDEKHAFAVYHKESTMEDED